MAAITRASSVDGRRDCATYFVFNVPGHDWRVRLLHRIARWLGIILEWDGKS